MLQKGCGTIRYTRIKEGVFLDRPNRFIANIHIDGAVQVCHVKNTGRCRELLTPNARVWCQEFDSPTRKTKFDLIAVEKGPRIINMDSIAPNAAAAEWLLAGGLGPVTEVKAEVFHGSSRFDFSFQKDGKPCFLEVKGVTLEQDGVCAFPDAPTVRGTRHLKELTEAAGQGYGAYVLFVIQMQNIEKFLPNEVTDPAFAQALKEAAAAGVQILAFDCAVTPEEMVIRDPVPIIL